MVAEKIKELEVARAKLASLEQSVVAELGKELAGLPARYGFASTNEFVAAVRAASRTRRGRKPGGKKSGNANAATGKRRKRATITDAMRTDVKKLVEAGKTAPEIAKAVGISEPSVANIKKAFGLTKRRK